MGFEYVYIFWFEYYMGSMNGVVFYLYIFLDYVRVYGKIIFLIVMLLSFGLFYFEENGVMLF